MIITLLMFKIYNNINFVPWTPDEPNLLDTVNRLKPNYSTHEANSISNSIALTQLFCSAYLLLTCDYIIL